MRHAARLIAGAALFAVAIAGRATPPTPERIMELCGQVEGPAHCGRLVEAEQLKSLPSLAVRDGDTLRVSLFPSGTRNFVDTLASGNETSYAVWDYWSPINAVVLFVVTNDTIGYAVLQRASGAYTALAAEPLLAPDRQHVVVADVCAKDCANEIVVLKVAREGLQRELLWKPPAGWSDVTAAWKNPDTVTIQYTAGGEPPRTIERKLTAADWRRP